MSSRLALVIHALNSGGAERVLASLASHWADSGREVTLITLAEMATDRYPLDPRVTRVGLGLQKPSRSAWDALRNNWRRIRNLRKAIHESGADTVVSFTDQMNVLALLASRRARWPVVIAERNDPRRQRMSRLWERLRRWMYPRCAAAVVQTDGVAQYVRGLVGRKPVYVIANAVEAPTAKPVSSEVPQSPRPYIVAMGRLDVQKGFDLLIEAFSRIAVERAELDLRIIGEGPQRAILEQQIADCGLEGRVQLAGWREHPESVLQAASFFVLSSRWEGFPNALLEAMACGLPAISFDCDSGPGEIIRHEVDGLLVPPEEVPALAAAIDRLWGDAEFRRRMAERARDVITRFNEAEFFRRWDEVLQSTCPSSAVCSENAAAGRP